MAECQYKCNKKTNYFNLADKNSIGESLTKNRTSHPYIKIKDIKTTKYLELDSAFEYIENETYDKISRYVVSKNDVIISIVGSIGCIAKIGKSLHN